jgi:hypothetical protein
MIITDQKNKKIKSTAPMLKRALEIMNHVWSQSSAFVLPGVGELVPPFANASQNENRYLSRFPADSSDSRQGASCPPAGSS